MWYIQPLSTHTLSGTNLTDEMNEKTHHHLTHMTKWIGQNTPPVTHDQMDG